MSNLPGIDAGEVRPVGGDRQGLEGVGAEFAEQVSAAGLNVVLVARKKAPLEETAERCRALGADVLVISADLTVPPTSNSSWTRLTGSTSACSSQRGRQQLRLAVRRR
jgi:NAD(P)-dependent dehydrogenase (short-subunit alcohol dehydrogenase family)